MRFCEEATSQTEKEAELNLPVTAFMQIGKDINKIKQSQIGFINIFIMPSILELAKTFPECQELLENC